VSDGPRQPSDRDAVQQCRDIVEKVDWPCEVTQVYSDENLGLKQRVITGLDYVFSREESAIILEDDCLPSSSFFPYCDELLNRFSGDPRLALVSGNKFHQAKTSDHSYDFSHDAFIWGWATWSHVWKEFTKALSGLESGLSQEQKFSLSESFSSPSKKIQFLKQVREVEGATVDSWAIYFASFVRINSLLVAIPEKNLVRNIGFGGVSTHTKFEAFDVDVTEEELQFPLRHPAVIQNNPSIERLETKTKVLRWLYFPLRHPLDFLGRFVRYFRVSARSEREKKSSSTS